MQPFRAVGSALGEGPVWDSASGTWLATNRSWRDEPPDIAVVSHVGRLATLVAWIKCGTIESLAADAAKSIA